MEKKKSNIGIKILGVSGILISILAFGFFLWSNIAHEDQFRISLGKNIIFFFFIVFLIISFLGIFFLKNWGRVSIIFITWFKIVESVGRALNYVVTDLSQLRIVHISEQVFNIIIYGLLIFYLSRESVKNEFNKKR